MRRPWLGGAIVVALLLSACSVSAATDHVGTLDAHARQACADARAFAQELSAGSVSPAQVRERAGQIYQEAQASSNPILAAKAVALYADGTSAMMGGEGTHFRSDLEALTRTCGSVGG
jgi:hypothetical protein